MDTLARNAMLARQANMSYGKWKALQPIVPIVKEKTPEGWQTCEYCGEQFKPRNGKKFCSDKCRTVYNEKRRYRKWANLK